MIHKDMLCNFYIKCETWSGQRIFVASELFNLQCIVRINHSNIFNTTLLLIIINLNELFTIPNKYDTIYPNTFYLQSIPGKCL